MLKKVQEAVAMRAEHVVHFNTLSDSLPLATISKFTSLIQAWEAGESQENPYQATVEGKHRDDINNMIYHRRCLAAVLYHPFLMYHKPY